MLLLQMRMAEIASQQEEQRRAEEAAAIAARQQETARKAALAEARRQKLEADVQVAHRVASGSSLPPHPSPLINACLTSDGGSGRAVLCVQARILRDRKLKEIAESAAQGKLGAAPADSAATSEALERKRRHDFQALGMARPCMPPRLTPGLSAGFTGPYLVCVAPTSSCC